MPYLVKYIEDDILQVVSKVLRRKFCLKAKYLDGRYYEAKIVAEHPSKQLLTELCRNLEDNLPIVKVYKVNIVEHEPLSSHIFEEINVTAYANDTAFTLKNIETKATFNLGQELVENFAEDNFNLSKECVFQNVQSDNDCMSDDNTITAKNSQIEDTLNLGQRLIPKLAENNLQSVEDLVFPNGIQTEEMSDSQILDEALQYKIIILDNTIIKPSNKERVNQVEKNYLKQSTAVDYCAIDNATAEKYIHIEDDPNLGQKFKQNLMEDNLNMNEECIPQNIPQRDIQSGTKRAGQKRHCCYYCKKKLFKIYRHYVNVHRNEREIRAIIALPPKSLHRKELLDNLRKKGDYFFNTEIKNEHEEQIVCRETYNKLTRQKNVPCPKCKGYYSKFSVRHHIQKCMPHKEKYGRSNIQAECRKLENNIHIGASEVLRTKIFPVLNEDAVTNTIRYDEAVINYGNYLCRKYTAEHHYPQIRANMRALGRLILAIKEINPQVKNLSDALDPLCIDLITQGIDKVAGLDPVSHLYKAPATAMLLATELKKLCRLMEMEFIKTRDKEGQKKMEDLHLLFDLEFRVTVNKKGLETQKINNRRRKIDLPKTEQIAQFRLFLETNIRLYIKNLETEYSLKDWTHLAEYTLAHLAVFNRKRPGETQRIQIDDYQNYEIVDEDLSNELDTLSREQIKKWARIRFTGKLGKNTALLIHRELGFKAIDLILKYRSRAGVHPYNIFVFGEPSQYKTQTTFQACNLIRKFSFESGIDNHKLLRTRLLRQHLATETAQSSIDPRLEGRLSDFMSHKRQIHEDYYVMTQKKDDITKVSRLLENFSSFDTPNKQPKSCHNLSSWSDPNEDLGISSDDQDFDTQEISDRELNYILGKKQKRRPWSTLEKNVARDYFHDEIYCGTMLERKKVNHFFKLKKNIYIHRDPHLIMQWVKLERKKFLSAKKEQGRRRRWSTPEKEVLRSSTERHSSDGTTPTLIECESLIEEHGVLKKRTPTMVKSFIYTEIKRNKKNSS